MLFKKSDPVRGTPKDKLRSIKLDILFRSCTRVPAVHGGDRPFGASKQEATLCSLKSLLDSITDDCTVHVLDDHSPEEDVRIMKKLLGKNAKRHQFISIEPTGNGESMESNFQYAKDGGFELICFSEDDYLYLPEAIPVMLDFYKQFDRDCIIHPTDYIDRYTRAPYESLIFLGPDRHWRTIKHTTGTFMISKRILETYWDLYMNFAEINKEESGGEDASINKIYQKEMCVSPMPSLAAHFSPDPEMPRFVDWQELFEQLKIQVESEGHKVK